VHSALRAISLPIGYAGEGLRISDAVSEDNAHDSATESSAWMTRVSIVLYLHLAPRAADFNMADLEFCGI
jgi:hypothetical protein